VRLPGRVPGCLAGFSSIDPGRLKTKPSSKGLPPDDKADEK
jgi:hypothetical protein